MTTDRPLEVAIAAEVIPSVEGGLGYFILSAIRWLSTVEPSWRFKVVATSTFEELENINLPNVEVIVWDKSPLMCRFAVVLRRLGVQNPALTSYEIGRYVPSWKLKEKWGFLKAIWKSLGNVDAIWAPQYSIAHEATRYSLWNNMSLARAPILFTIHDIHPVFFPDDWSVESLNRFRDQFVPFARRSRRIITHAEFQKEAIVEHLNIEPEKVFVTNYPPLIDPDLLLREFADSDISEFLASRDIRRPYALYTASSTHSHKNHTRLILAWNELRKKLGDACPALVCTAKGHLYPALRSLTEALGLEPVVHFTGTVNTAELAMLYQACSFVIVPTLYEGGGGGPVAEAILTGKPLLCSRIPQIEEHLRYYRNTAVLFDPNSVDDILQTTESCLSRLPELQTKASKEQQRLLSRVPEMWQEWADFYTRHLRDIATDEKAGHGGGS